MRRSRLFYKVLTAGLICLALAIMAVAFAMVLTGCGAGGTVGVKAEKAYVSFASNEVFNLRQVITADSSTSRTIMWQSEKEEQGALVEYRPLAKEGIPVLPEEVFSQAAQINDRFTDDKVSSWIHTATLQNLKPGTVYEYRLGYGDNRSPWYKLNTASGKSRYKALIFPDSQSADYKTWENIAKPAWQRNPEAEFFISMGDLVDNGEHAYQWNQWFSRVQDMIARIPAVPLMGNHETYTRDWKVRMPLAYLHHFTLPPGAPEAYKNQFYSFDYGDVHYVILNTQWREMKEFQPQLLQDQIAWFEKDMASSSKKWKVVLMHKDPLQYGFLTRTTPRAEGFSEEGRTWMPLFDRHKVDVVLSAHLHTYRNRGHIYDFRRAEKGPLYIITGVAGDVRYPSLWKNHSLDRYVAPQPETNNYLVLEAEENTLRITGYLPDGTKLDQAEVHK